MNLTMSQFDVGSEMLAGNERWFLVHTHRRRERKAEWHLRAQGFKTYLPQIRKTIRHARQLKNGSDAAISRLPLYNP